MKKAKADAAKHYDENYFIDYADGIRDCINGEPHEADQSARYDQGYSDQYTLEQVSGRRE